jgi:hypothetical protein
MFAQLGRGVRTQLDLLPDQREEKMAPSAGWGRSPFLGKILIHYIRGAAERQKIRLGNKGRGTRPANLLHQSGLAG